MIRIVFVVKIICTEDANTQAKKPNMLTKFLGAIPWAPYSTDPRGNFLNGNLFNSDNHSDTRWLHPSLSMPVQSKTTLEEQYSGANTGPLEILKLLILSSYLSLNRVRIQSLGCPTGSQQEFCI